MATELFEKQSAKVRDAYGVGLGADAGVFSGDRLTIAERPEPNWGYAVNGVTFAKGSLIAVAPQLLEFAGANAPARHREAVTDQCFGTLRRAAIGLGMGESLQAFAGGLGWALARMPADPTLPAGLRFAPVTREWLDDQIPKGTFENGAGPADGGGGRSFRNQYGVSVENSDGEVVALAGVFDSYGLHEIGVDVIAEHQGQGLGVAVVAAALLAILERGGTPFYGCAPTNIRSQHTALAAGFAPVCSYGSIS